MQRANDTIDPLRVDGRGGSIADQVFRTLRSSIVTMRLTPATALSEQDIASRLKVSRQPVREAFIKLSEIGLVRVLPQRGTFVVKISAKAVTDARFVREAVECAIARRASEGIGKAAMDDLRGILSDQRKAARDPEAFFVLDAERPPGHAAPGDPRRHRGRARWGGRSSDEGSPARDPQVVAAALAHLPGHV
jgi:DNA-binding GntR family transcriptional regulator